MKSRERIMLTFMLLLLLLGVLAVNGNPTEPFSLRLVGGSGRCQGELQVQRAGQDWIGVTPGGGGSLSFGNRICAELDCGSALSVVKKMVPPRDVVILSPDRCDDTSLIDCFPPKTYSSPYSLELSCSDSVRLDGGKRLCSGSLKFRRHYLDQSWTEVCEGALGRRGAEVVCRELGCGPPVLQGALSLRGETFQCEGNESALTNCPWLLPGFEGPCSALQLTCAEPMRLVDGLGRCEGILEVKYEGEWRRLGSTDTWTAAGAAGVCRDLDCGFAVSAEAAQGLPRAVVWFLKETCAMAATVRECVHLGDSVPYPSGVKVVCSGKGETHQASLLTQLISLLLGLAAGHMI